jgi:hypothetical protein
MAHAISIDIFQLLEEKLGKEEGRKVAQAIEIGLEVIEKKAESVALQKKLELRDELTKELANKADIARLEGKIVWLEEKMGKDILRLDRKFTIMFIILFFTVIFLNQNALEFMFKVLGLIK